MNVSEISNFSPNRKKFTLRAISIWAKKFKKN